MEEFKTSFNLSILSDFEHFPFVDILSWVVFIITVVLQSIIMLNLLIAIISDTFDRVHQKRIATDCQIRCKLIYDTEDLSFYNRDKGQKKFLHLCRYKSSEQEIEDETIGFIRALKNLIYNTQRVLTYTMATLENKSDE